MRRVSREYSSIMYITIRRSVIPLTMESKGRQSESVMKPPGILLCYTD